MLARPAPCSMCPGLHIPFVEQNFLINKQDLGFHIGEVMTEEGLGLSALSAPGLPTLPRCLEGLRGERKEAWAKSTFLAKESLPGSWPQLLWFPVMSLSLATRTSAWPDLST